MSQFFPLRFVRGLLLVQRYRTLLLSSCHRDVLAFTPSASQMGALFVALIAQSISDRQCNCSSWQVSISTCVAYFNQITTSPVRAAQSSQELSLSSKHQLQQVVSVETTSCNQSSRVLLTIRACPDVADSRCTGLRIELGTVRNRYLLPLSLGSRMSRRASPNRLMPNAVMVSARPGKTLVHGPAAM